MNKVVVDETVKSKLNDIEVELEFVVERGQTLGCSLPAADHDRLTKLAAEERRRLDRRGFSQLADEQTDAAKNDKDLRLYLIDIPDSGWSFDRCCNCPKALPNRFVD